MIPRYHPQVCPFAILGSAVRGGGEVSLAPAAPRQLTEGQDLFAFNGATAALVAILRALGLPAGSGVAVPIYTCLTVFEAVRQAGLSCVFVDIDPGTFGYDLADLERRRAGISAAIVVHTFGYPADLDAIRGVLGDRAIVEDCSHSLGSTYRGRATGFHGCAGAFSFNFQKPVSVGGGGLLVVNDAKLAPAAGEQWLALPEAPRRVGAKALARRLVKAALYRAPWYGGLMKAGLLAPDREAVLRTVELGRMTAMDRALIGRGMAKPAARIAACRAWAAEMTAHAGPLAPACRFVEAGADWNGYLWPIVLPAAEVRDRSLAFFRRRGVDAFVLWPECLKAAEDFGYRPGGCPRGEDALRRLMFLPCYAELTAARRRRILEAIDSWRREVLG
jgi:dTDP-4-amino-4,6-dideoxygalactose transaminase